MASGKSEALGSFMQTKKFLHGQCWLVRTDVDRFFFLALFRFNDSSSLAHVSSDHLARTSQCLDLEQSVAPL